MLGKVNTIPFVCVPFIQRRYKVQEWNSSVKAVYLMIISYFGAYFSKHYGILGLQGFVCEYKLFIFNVLILCFLLTYNDYNLMDNPNLGGREEDVELF